MLMKKNLTRRVVVGFLGIVATCVNAQSAPFDDKAVAVWNFDEGAGNVLADSSGHGHHGTITGAEWITGSFGSALRFDREERHYVTVPDAEEFRLQPPFTIGVWFRTTSSKNNAVFLISSLDSTRKICGTFLDHFLFLSFS